MTLQSQAILSRIENKLDEIGVDYPEYYEFRDQCFRELLEIVEMQREALEKVSANKTLTVYNSSEEFMQGANVAFGQSAELADDALAQSDERLKRLGSNAT